MNTTIPATPFYSSRSASHAWREARKRAQAAGHYLNPQRIVREDDMQHLCCGIVHVLRVGRYRSEYVYKVFHVPASNHG